MNQSYNPPRFLVNILWLLNRFLIRCAQLVLPPQKTVFDHIVGLFSTMLLHVAANLRIADHLHKQPMTAEELAAIVGGQTDAIYRMMRGLVSLGFFQLSANGQFKNNRLSETLRTDVYGSFRDIADYIGSKSNVESWINIKDTILTGDNAFEKLHQMTLWDWFQKHPEEGRVFAAAVSNWTELHSPVIAAAYPFQQIKKLCDIAGGRGSLLAGILKQHSHLEAVLVDAEYVLEEAVNYLTVQGVQKRVQRVTGNFFESLPQECKECDAYLLRDILHDWDDERSLQILSNVRKVMKPGNRLLIIEEVVEKFDTMPLGPLMQDVHMMVVCGGKQRSQVDFINLFEKTGFHLKQIISTSLPVSIVEGVAI